METVSLKVWTRLNLSISYDDNHCTMNASSLSASHCNLIETKLSLTKKLKNCKWFQPFFIWSICSYRFIFHQCNLGNLRGVVDNLVDYDIIVSEFELQSCYYVYFGTNALWKGMKRILPKYGLNSITPVLLQGCLWHYINREDWYTIKQRIQTNPLEFFHQLCICQRYIHGCTFSRSLNFDIKTSVFFSFWQDVHSKKKENSTHSKRFIFHNEFCTSLLLYLSLSLRLSVSLSIYIYIYIYSQLSLSPHFHLPITTSISLSHSLCVCVCVCAPLL